MIEQTKNPHERVRMAVEYCIRLSLLHRNALLEILALQKFEAGFEKLLAIHDEDGIEINRITALVDQLREELGKKSPYVNEDMNKKYRERISQLTEKIDYLQRQLDNTNDRTLSWWKDLRYGLTGNEQQVVTLLHDQMKTIAEVADIMDSSEYDVEKLYQQAAEKYHDYKNKALPQ